MSYNTVFDLANNDATVKLAVIQDGQSLVMATREALSLPLAMSATGATVSAATIVPTVSCRLAHVVMSCAMVTYSVLGPHGQPLIPNATGLAVYVNSHGW